MQEREASGAAYVNYNGQDISLVELREKLNRAADGVEIPAFTPPSQPIHEPEPETDRPLTQIEHDVEAFEERFKGLIGDMTALHDNKRKRYTGAADPLENYLMCSEWIARILMQQYPDAAEFVRSRGAMFAMIARHGEKFQRLVTMVGQDDFLDPDQGEGEGISDTLMDISIIAFLEEIEAWRLREREKN